MGAATGSATLGSRDAPGHCTTRCRRPPRPRRAARQQTTTKSTAIPYGTAQAGAQTLATSGLKDFRVPFVSDAFSHVVLLRRGITPLGLRHLAKVANLRSLGVLEAGSSRPSVLDASLALLTKLPVLESLSNFSPYVTDAGLSHI